MNKHEVLIRPMNPEDWQMVAIIYKEGIDTGNATFQQEVPTWHEWDASHLKSCRLIAEVNHKIAGWAALSAVSKQTVYSGVAEVSIADIIIHFVISREKSVCKRLNVVIVFYFRLNYFSMKASNAFLFFWKSNFMYIGKGITTKIHDHHAIQLIIDLDGEFELHSDVKGHENFKAVLIGSDFPHECITGDDTMLILNISPESRVGINLKRDYLAENGYEAIDNEVTTGFIKELVSLINAEINEKHIVAVTEQYLNRMSGTESPSLIDDRIKLAITLLEKKEWGVIKVKDIADSVFISESRLIHLFKQQVGVPIRKYILWLRLVKAIQYSLKNNNITQAAIAAGFSDAPHFNKTLKRMFGLNLTNLKYSQFIQAYWV